MTIGLLIFLMGLGTFVEALNKEQKQWCGRQLEGMLRNVCKGSFYSDQDRKYVKKREYKQYKPDNEIDYENLEQKFINYPKFRPISMFYAVKRSKKIGIVDECCYRSCSREELSNYCSKN